MYNKVILIGRLVADPEMRTTPNGVNVSTFTIAVDRPFTPKGAERKADFLTIVSWRQQAEFVCRYFSKGKAIGVEGSIQVRDYTDKEGSKRYATEIISDRLFFVGEKASGGSNERPSAGTGFPDESNAGASYSNGSAPDFAPIEGDDDLPF